MLPHRQPLSVAQHVEQAKYHDSEAASHEAQYQPEGPTTNGEPVQCIDHPLAGVPHSGTESLEVMKPCWTSVTNPTAHHLEKAKYHREVAANHRRAAKTLLSNEAEACGGLGADEISHSPFFHTEDILAVEEYRDGGELMGVRVRFRKVPGLTTSWMRRALHCHQTRAAVMGYSTTFQSYCPASVYGAAVSVADEGGDVLVSIRGENEDIGAVVHGRANDLLKKNKP